MSIKLIKLSVQYKNQLIEMIEEWKKDQEENHTNRSPWAIFKNDCHDFEYYLDNLEIKESTVDRSKDSTFFLYDDTRDKMLGAVNIRHELLHEDMSHIGDGIRPSERRKGYGTLIIRLALEECKKLGIYDVLMTCSKDNIGSKKVIINNGGIYSGDHKCSDGEIEERYWIHLNK